ncbi:chloride channel protein [Planctomycetales bacterium]|nr:chloride channel protein [Planctomycetales bacterium]
MMIKCFHFRNGYLRERIPFVKLLASYFTICSGGSAGWEGPALITGSGIASSISRRKRLNGKDRRILFLAGAAGGLGAIFQIPFGGALVAVEVLYASTAIELSALIPCIVSSVTGYSVFRILHYYFYGHPLWTFNLSGLAVIRQPVDWIILLGMVPIIAVCGLIFVKMVSEIKNRIFRRMHIPEFIKPAIGGGILGIIALFCPQVCGSGSNWLNHLLDGQLPFLLILIMILPKMLATACTLSSGGVGGMFVPSLFIGALVGNSLGFGCSFLFQHLGIPSWSPSIPLCTLAGISVFYAGIAKVPFAAALIACEISGGYSLMIPFIALNLVHIAIQSPSASLYEEQVLAPIDSEAHFGTYSVDLLKAMTVKEAHDSEPNAGVQLAVLPADGTIPQAAALIASRPDTLFPVVYQDGKLAGIVLTEDIWAAFRSRRKWDDVSVLDITQTPDESGKLRMAVCPDDNLYLPLRLCILEHISALPVVDPLEPDKLLGILHQNSIITAYNKRLAVSRWN